MLTFAAFTVGGTLGVLFMAIFVAGARADEPHRRIRGKQEQEAVADKLGAAELSVPHAQPTAPVGARNHA